MRMAHNEFFFSFPRFALGKLQKKGFKAQVALTRQKCAQKLTPYNVNRKKRSVPFYGFIRERQSQVGGPRRRAVNAGDFLRLRVDTIVICRYKFSY
ncbi:hypothetical protein EVAR_33367_1 [Eumeta japonica]|uniref:Uncharacterized protein n=1 Tax=Eumeta variegata TaxID=151549 RepID=A0A4C1X443_EUMVA|nr:hypothetical protein EVAR_33367_1 [Eumeta japonica]